MKNQIEKLLGRKDPILHEGRIGLFTNQTAYSPIRAEYLYESLLSRGVLRRLFLPEHGLFAELQDQVGLDDTGLYALPPEVDVCSLYGTDESTLRPKSDWFADLDGFIAAIQDIGTRYYTFATTLNYLISAMAELDSPPVLYIVDAPNPAGRSVEGTALPLEYASFVGCPGLPHRHGLSIAELTQFFIDKHDYSGEFHIIRIEDARATTNYLAVAPSPNMPDVQTARVYSGQCLLEGTNVSEGRGTVMPFRMFGAPYMKFNAKLKKIPRAKGVNMRALRFMPAFHKYKGQVCSGFEMQLVSDSYHSLAHTLRMIRWIHEQYPEDFAFRQGVYEFCSDKTAIEILCGDDTLLDFINGRCDESVLAQALADGEQDWMNQCEKYLLYKDPLFRILDPFSEV